MEQNQLFFSAGIKANTQDFISEEEKKKLFFVSDFIKKAVSKEPTILTNNDIHKSYKKEDFVSNAVPNDISTIDELISHLKKVRQKEMVRIAVRDILFKADLIETMRDLSFLAEAIVDETLKFFYEKEAEKFGIPLSDGEKQNIVVLGFGKIGGFELNFSSDIDLIFAYPKSGYTNSETKSITNERFFINVIRNFLQVFESRKEEGIIFRVDLRLRPYGENGPLVMNFNAIEDYYQTQGREWERYALIKARPIAGDIKKGEELLKSLKPFIYRKYLDYTVFESLREMKKKIENHIKKDVLKNNIKLGKGGIREIEFFGQIFQLLRGGLIEQLQEKNILKLLGHLKEKKIINREEEKELRLAYIFLRYVENRLQQFNDEQTHDIPTQQEKIEKIAFALNFETTDTFLSNLKNHRDNVHNHFSSLLKIETDKEEEQTSEEEELWLNLNNNETFDSFFKSSNLEDFEKISKLLVDFKKSIRSLPLITQSLFDKLIPVLIKKAKDSDKPDISIFRTLEFINTIKRKTAYISLLIENPQAIDVLISLSSESSWAINFLCKNPLLLDEFLDVRNELPEKEEILKELDKINSYKKNDIEKYVDDLRIFKKIGVFRVALCDITNKLPLMKISDNLTYLAEALLEKVLEISYLELKKKYGLPKKNEFIIVAYGKLGGIELGYNSDLDIVFLYDTNDSQTDGKNSIENTLFFSRLAQKITHILTIKTSADILYEVDLRLRPGGNKGTVVSSISSFEEYQKKSAWTFEHQAIIRARVVAGSPRLKKKFEQIRDEIIRGTDKTNLKDDVIKMSHSIKKEHLKNAKDFFDLKYSDGGIVDIEFLIQYLVLKNAEKYLELTKWTDVIRIVETIIKCGLLSENDGDFLKNAYITYRSKAHRLSLKDRPRIVPLDEVRDISEKVITIWKKSFE